MKVIGQDNNMKIGFQEWPAFARTLLESITEEMLSQTIPDNVIRNVKRVIITGCGDSFAATLATKNFNAEMFNGCDYHALRTIDVSRHHVFPAGEDNRDTLVIVISVSGTGARVTEAMMRAANAGCTTLAITGHPESRMAQAAEYVLELQIPKLSAYSVAAQTQSYFCAVLTTTLIGLHAGLLRGAINAQEAAAQREEILRYVHAVCDKLDEIDCRIEHVADSFKDYIGYDFVGAGSDFATAYFGSAKFFESIGALCCLNDSEDWCHINFFMRNRTQLGTIVVASRNSNSFSRSAETIASMKKSDRNVLVITDTAATAFIDGVIVCTLPATEYEHITPLMNYIPICMLGNYIAIKNDLEYFGGTGPENPLFSQDGGINTIKTSEIVLVD